MRKTIADALAKNIERPNSPTSKGGVPLFFEEINYSDKYAELFGIEKSELFNRAFKSVTEGVGGEINKINSVESSALLGLLAFFPLYSKQCALTISLPELGKVTFNRCFYEVRNKVIGFPSCVDVALQSEDGKILLYLESKLSEYEEIDTEMSYGISYHELYKNLTDMLNAVSFKESVNDKEDEMVLKSDNAVYIEGIKQTISHLIGLVKGPQHKMDAFYDSIEYEKAYSDAETLVYGTILFNPNAIGIDSNSFESYKCLYENFAKAKDSILVAIRKWANKSDRNKNIIILPEVQTYQCFFPQEYLSNLSEKVRKFYAI